MRHFLLYISIIVLLLGCSKDNHDQNCDTQGRNRVQTVCNLSIAPMGGDMQIGTRAQEVNDVEQTIKDVWVLQFNEDGSACLAKEYITAIDNGGNILPDLIDGKSIIWFVTNTNNSTLFSSIATLDEFKAQQLTLSNTSPRQSAFTNYGTDQNYLRAAVEWTGTVMSDININAVLVPLAAKWTVTYSVGLSGYEISTMQVRNVPLSMNYATTSGNTTPYQHNAVRTNFVEQTITEESASNTGTAGSAVFYVPESIAGVIGENSDPKAKNLSAPPEAMLISLQGTKPDGSIFTISIYPGGNNTNDFNVQIGKNYNIVVNLTSDESLWAQDSRIKGEYAIPTENLAVHYEFTNVLTNNSMYQADGVTPLDLTTTFLRNLSTQANKKDDCTQRVNPNSGLSSPPPLKQEFNATDKCMDFSGYAFNTNFLGNGVSSENPFTIVAIMSVGSYSSMGASLYGPNNGGTKRWYTTILKSNNAITYGSQENMTQQIPNYTYTYNTNLFVVDINSNSDNLFVRNILINDISAQALSGTHYTFASGFYLGCNGNEPNYVCQEAKLYLLLLYDRVLTTAETEDIKYYARNKGYLD